MMEIITGYTGVPHVRSEDMGAIYAAIFGDASGVLPIGAKFDYTLNTATQITIGSGDLLINGRHGRIRNGDNQVLTFDSGTTGMKRNDLIVARYLNNGTTESINLIVLKGNPVQENPVDPDYVVGNVLTGSAQADYPLYRVYFDGLNAPQVTKLFTIIGPNNYSIGDTIKNRDTGGEVCCGYLTNTATQLIVHIPEKSFDPGVTALTANYIRLVLLHPDGGFPYMRWGNSGTGYQQLGSTYVNIVLNRAVQTGVVSYSAVPVNGGIRLAIQFNWALVKTSGQSSSYVTNNVPVAALIDYEFTAA